MLWRKRFVRPNLAEREWLRAVFGRGWGDVRNDWRLGGISIDWAVFGLGECLCLFAYAFFIIRN